MEEEQRQRKFPTLLRQLSKNKQVDYDVMLIYNEIYKVVRKDETTQFSATQMELEDYVE